MGSAIPDGELETAADMAEALRAGQVRAVELVERALSRAERWQGPTNAFSQLWPEEALDRAALVDATPVGDRPPLAGVPLAVKDLFDVAGRETTGCCAAYRGTVASADAPTVVRAREAGLVIVGKTNQHELAAGATNLVSACGRTGNPWDPSRMTGGSSGGSGAAVAAGVLPWALGSDTGGSVRIPAAMCGTFGLKPTTGLIPIEGMLPHSPSLDCPGPLAATLEDLWLLHGVLVGEGAGVRLPADVGGRPGGPLPGDPTAPLRVGVVRNGFFREGVDPETLDVLERTAGILSGAGLEVREVEGGGIEDARFVWSRVAYPELYRAHLPLQDRRDLVHPTVLALLDFGRDLGAEERAAARRRREEIARWFESRLRAVDALLVPTTPFPARPAGEFAVPPGPPDVPLADRVGPGWLSCSVNLSGLPALSFPAGRSGDGLPVGLTLVGRKEEEGTLAAVAARWRDAVGYRPARPPLPRVSIR